MWWAEQSLETLFVSRDPSSRSRVVWCDKWHVSSRLPKKQRSRPPNSSFCFLFPPPFPPSKQRMLAWFPPNKIEPLSLETGNPKAPRVPSYSAGTGVSNGKLPNVRGKDFPKRPISRPARPRTFPFRPPCLPKSLVVFFVVGLSLVPHPQDKEVFDPGLFGFEHLIFDKCGSTLYFVYKVHLRGLPLVESPSNHIQSPNVSITGYFPATSTLLPPKRLRLSPEWAHQ
jgi:hypothetical protein